MELKSTLRVYKPLLLPCTGTGVIAPVVKPLFPRVRGPSYIFYRGVHIASFYTFPEGVEAYCRATADTEYGIVESPALVRPTSDMDWACSVASGCKASISDTGWRDANCELVREYHHPLGPAISQPVSDSIYLLEIETDSGDKCDMGVYLDQTSTGLRRLIYQGKAASFRGILVGDGNVYAVANCGATIRLYKCNYNTCIVEVLWIEYHSWPNPPTTRFIRVPAVFVE